MKSWLAKTLLWSAIALVVFAGLWMLLDSKWSGEVERLRARPSASVEELLPPIDPADDAGPLYAEAWRAWAKLEHAAFDVRTNTSPPTNGVALDLQTFTAIDIPQEMETESPEIAPIEELLHAAAGKRHCRLWDPASRSWAHQELWGLVGLANRHLLPAAEHGESEVAWTHLECALALGVHLREDPLILALIASRGMTARSLALLSKLLATYPLSADHARLLLASVQRVHPEADVLRAMDGERVLFAEPAWDAIVAGRFPSGIWMRADLVDSLKLKLLRPWRLLDEGKYLETFDAARARLAADPVQVLSEPAIPDVFPITQIMSSGFPKLSGAWILEERRARDLTEIALRLAIVRAEHGAYPDSLAELGDTPREPLTNEPYSYARAGEGYTLSNWSIPR